MYRVRAAQGFGSSEPVAVQVRRAHEPPEDWGDVPWVDQNDLGAIVERAAELWPGIDLAEGLLSHVVEEGQQGNLLVGESPEEWSPLAGPDFGSLGRLESMEILSAGMVRDLTGEDVPMLTALPGSERFGAVGLRLGTEQVALGALVFAPDAMVLAVPPGVEHVDVEYVDETVQDEEGHAESHASPARPSGIEALLKREMPGYGVSTYLLVRLYQGDNSVALDDLVDPVGRSRGSRIGLAALRETGGFVVARALMAVHRRLPRDGRDFTAVKRRVLAEAQRPTTARECLDLAACGSVPGGRAVVAVHGTMACAVPLASSIRTVAAKGTPLLRFEHDTWLAVSANGKELADHVTRLGMERVLFVAHSRGGLVARQAAARLAERGGVSVEIVALGTPHRGTPLADAAQVGLLGLNVLMGFLRAMGGPTVDASTRLAGLLIKKQLPRGLEAMRTDSEHVGDTGFRVTPDCTCVAGVVDHTTAGRHHGLAGFARGAFQVDGTVAANDLVVGEASASACGTAVVQVARDHFSYLEEQSVRELVADRAAALLEGLEEMPPPPEPRQGPEDGTLNW